MLHQDEFEDMEQDIMLEASDSKLSPSKARALFWMECAGMNAQLAFLAYLQYGLGYENKTEGKLSLCIYDTKCVECIRADQLMQLWNSDKSGMFFIGTKIEKIGPPIIGTANHSNVVVAQSCKKTIWITYMGNEEALEKTGLEYRKLVCPVEDCPCPSGQPLLGIVPRSIESTLAAVHDNYFKPEGYPRYLEIINKVRKKYEKSG